MWLPGCCVARCRKKRNRGSKHVEKTLPQTFQNEAPGGQKWKPTWFQNGSKMIPKWLQRGSLEASGRPLGPTLLPDAPRSGPGRPKKFILAALERPWSEKWIDFGLLEGPGGGLGGHLGSFLAVGPAGTKKSRKVSKKKCFSCFCMRFLTAPVCVLFASALAGAQAQLKICLKQLVFTFLSACAPFARGARTSFKQKESRTQNCPNASEKHHATEARKQIKKHRFGSQNVSKNRPRRPPGAPWPPPARDFRAKSSPKALLGSLRGRKKVLELPRAPLEENSNDIGKNLPSRPTRGRPGRRCWRGP